MPQSTFDKLTQWLRRRIGAGVGKSVRIEVPGEGVIRIIGGEVTNEDGPADIKAELSAEVLEALWADRLNPVTALTTGQIKITNRLAAMAIAPAAIALLRAPAAAEQSIDPPDKFPLPVFSDDHGQEPIVPVLKPGGDARSTMKATRKARRNKRKRALAKVPKAGRDAAPGERRSAREDQPKGKAKRLRQAEADGEAKAAAKLEAKAAKRAARGALSAEERAARRVARAATAAPAED